eukprot:6550074-Prymnesium_polylepis.1
MKSRCKILWCGARTHGGRGGGDEEQVQHPGVRRTHTRWRGRGAMKSRCNNLGCGARTHGGGGGGR